MKWWEIALVAYFGCELFVVVDWMIAAAKAKKDGQQFHSEGLVKTILSTLICPPFAAMFVVSGWYFSVLDWFYSKKEKRK